MKKIVYLIFMLIIAAGCHRQTPERGKYPWTPLSPGFDSVNNEMETAFIDLASDSSKLSLLKKLKDEAKRTPRDPQIQSRTAFWESKVLSKMNYMDKAKEQIRRARELCDSSAFPYDMARIRYEESQLFPKGSVEVFIDARRDVEYYKSVGDSMMVGGMYIVIGNLYNELMDTTRSLEYFEKADRIYANSGYANLRLLNTLNLLNFTTREKADSILVRLNSSPVIANMRALHTIALYNSYLYTDSIELMWQLREIQTVDPVNETPIPLAQTEAMIANYYLGRDEKLDTAAYLARKSWRAAADNDSMPLLSRCESAAAMYNLYARLGVHDSALIFNDLSNNFYIQYLSESKNAEVTAAEMRIEIQLIEQEEEKKRRIKNICVTAVVCLIVSALIAIAIYIWIKLKKTRMARKEDRDELEQNRMQLAATKLVSQGKDSSVQKIKKIIENMRSQGKLSASDTLKINIELNSFANDGKELEAFQDIFDKLSPDFNKRILERCPDISEGLLRLAAYIAIGMSSHQIARMLVIDYGSVMKNRYRLRKKLNLQRGESLEAVLRELAGNDLNDGQP